ncbi:MAG: hypothetical protein E6073_04330 [Anaerococcus vaginalis]|nr:hypothetical protein [Anaerococcus vaginalis]MDU7164460.1 hypothetical protein [Anaerococcus vaginalis]
MIKYLKEENIDENLIKQLGAYRKENGLPDNARVIKPEYKYYGKEVLEEAIAVLLAEKNILLIGAKATGKNVLASNLAYLFKNRFNLLKKSNNENLVNLEIQKRQALVVFFS